jgi:hypothetical protein
MKISLMLATLILALKGNGQVSIGSYPLEISLNKTTHILFPFAVRSVDRGTRDVLVQKSSGDDHVLELKAGKADFQTTNVSVITADGKLYSFITRYAAEPALLNLSFLKDSLFINQKKFLHISTRSEGLRLSLRSIYIEEKVMWFGFQLRNNSGIGFEPGYIKFFIQDKRRVKRRAEQENQLLPLNRVSFETVPGFDQREFVFAFPSFTIPGDKRLVCQVSEANGGRQLSLGIRHKAILKARRAIP